MLKVEEWMDIHLLSRQGHSIRSIMRLTNLSRNTIRRALRQQHAHQPYCSSNRGSKLDQFKPYVERHWAECGLSAVRLLEEIRGMGYDGGVHTVRRFLETVGGNQKRLDKATIRFETPPGRQAQADWAYCGRFTDALGRVVPIYAFVIVLSFSRYMYVEFTTSMKIETLIGCHLQAFNYFGGLARDDTLRQHEASKTGAGRVQSVVFGLCQSLWSGAQDTSGEAASHKRQGRTDGRLRQRQFPERTRVR